MYEPIHGSAPDIAGRGIANPIGTILSAAMLARWSLGREDVAAAIEAAVAGALDVGARTADLAAPGQDSASTTEMTEAIVARIAITEAARATAAAPT
jgi:3-isopropylmalate dehydrogenase